MDLKPVWTVNCVHHQFINCSLCAVPYQDKTSCCMCSLSFHYACKFWCWNVNALKVLYTTSENYQTIEFHNTFTKSFTKHKIQHVRIVFWATTVCQFLSLTLVMLVLSEKREKQVLRMHQSYFKVLLQNSVWYWSNIVHYPFRLFLMSCPICTVTAKIRSMSYIVTSVRGKMRIVLSLTSPSTVSNTGLFVPPLDGCNACVI